MANRWSAVRKRLEEDLLCEKLYGRVQYFITHYRKAHDESGRFAVRVDGKDIIFAHPFNEVAVDRNTDRVKEELCEQRSWETLLEEAPERYEEIYRKGDMMCIRNNQMEIYHMTEAIRDYLNAPIQQSIQSENPAVRMFAVLDRRVGKRTLRTLRDTLDQQPEWLKPIYRLRFEAEEIL